MSRPRRDAGRRHPRGYSVLVAGPSGSGKTVLATQFIPEGVKRGEPGVIAIFEKRPAGYLQTTLAGPDLDQMIREGQLAVLYLRPLDLSVDETLYELRAVDRAHGAKRVVIDSLSGFEMALAPAFREDFRESLYRMVGVADRLGRHRDDDPGDRGRLHGAPAQPARERLPHRRHHPPALRRAGGTLKR